MGAKLQYRQNPQPELVVHVMAVAGEVVDQEAEREVADPYVIAHALELIADGYDVTVVTEDHIDRLPLKIALTTACDRLHVQHARLHVFLQRLEQPA